MEPEPKPIPPKAELLAARKRIDELEAMVRDLSMLELPPPEVDELLRTLHHALKVVAFAVGNAPPTATHGWPFEDLRSLSHLIEGIERVDPDYRSVAKDWLSVAAEAEDCEKIRAERRKRATGAAPPSAEERLEGALSLYTAMPDVARLKLPKEVLQQLEGGEGHSPIPPPPSKHHKPSWTPYILTAGVATVIGIQVGRWLGWW